MVLGEGDGKNGHGDGGLKALQEVMVQRGDIPRSYLISEERIARARGFPTVEVQDREGMLHL
jgi:hypothetical protein